MFKFTRISSLRPQALQLLGQSLELIEQIGDVRGKAATLNNMARIIAQQGNIPQALQLFGQSLELDERLGDVGGKAAILNNMADIIAQQGDIPQALQLYQQAAEACAQVRAYPDLVTVLRNLGAYDENKSQIYLAQAIWLSLRIQLPVANIITMLVHLYQVLSPEEPLAALLGATAMFFYSRLSEDDPQLEQFQKWVNIMLSETASAQGIDIETPEECKTWFVQQRLNEPSFFFYQLNQHLEAMVGDEWLFDRAAVVGES